MAYEIDHIFILSDVDAPAANKLVAAGITEGASNVHTGQGTTNRRFFFNNTMIECIWVHDATEAASDRTSPTHLLPRWQRRMDTSPFGICFRPTTDDQPPAPFVSFDYAPAYMPDDMVIQIADSVDQLQEPFLFYAGWLPPRDPAQAPIEHAAGMKNLTAVTVTHPNADLTSPAIHAISHLVTFKAGDRHCVTVTFDDNAQGKTLDLTPDLPLIVHC